ncbi:hypothetical protein, partial [Escherichia coli]|uniref:hypothetical protein n=1 Tax=Escherichia coli TaxID=562 RepID=UPI001BCA87BA
EGWAILLRQKQKKLIMLPSETMIWQPEFTDKTLSRKIGAVHSPTRTKGFNLNIPYLHEVTTKIKWVIAHIFFTSPCVRQHRGGLICMQVIIPESRNSL